MIKSKEVTEYIDSGMIALSSSFDVMSVNQEACRILGISPRLGEACPLEKLFDPDFIGTADRLLKDVLLNGVVLNDISVSLNHEGNRKINCRISALPLKDINKKIIGILLSFKQIVKENSHNDDSSRLQYLPRLNYQGLVDGLPEGVFTLNTSWKISSVNKRAELVTGYRKEEIIGKYCWQVFQSGMCKQRCPLADVLNNGKPCENEAVTIIHRNGSSRTILVNAEPIKSDDGSIIGGIETFRPMPSTPKKKRVPGQCRVNGVFEGMIGNGKVMQTIFTKLPDIAKSRASVLITGESGTGKELIARAIHNLADQSNRSFIAVNCSALPETLLESELFGHEKGAFTGAETSKPGRFELAANGTLFLDEIGDLKPSLQVKLLRVLEQKEFERVGGMKPIRLKARIIAATNQDLGNALSIGSFREDLYYRLRTIPVNLPPLRERPEDIAPLTDYFIRQFNHLYGKSVRLADPKVLECFSGYPWPGNIRELKRIVEHAFVFVRGPIIFKRHLPENEGFKTVQSLGMPDESDEKETLLRTLAQTGGNRAETAAILGISRTSLWRRMKKAGLIIEKNQINSC